jgi:hypothetical protein
LRVDWFNNRRLHSACHDIPPAEYEREHYRSITVLETLETAEPSLHLTRGGSYLFYRLDTATSGEYDHLVPLELGGTNSTSNLWVEIGAIPNPKDTVENRLHQGVCAGRLTLAAAQQGIATDWTAAP